MCACRVPCRLAQYGSRLAVQSGQAKRKPNKTAKIGDAERFIILFDIEFYWFKAVSNFHTNIFCPEQIMTLILWKNGGWHRICVFTSNAWNKSKRRNRPICSLYQHNHYCEMVKNTNKTNSSAHKSPAEHCPPWRSALSRNSHQTMEYWLKWFLVW